ncbi:hypothetical protein RGQ29_017265 [Quercus rubra]|uniref:Uncharacterized protein n=1 Tax=Quercus rubra TaxID=3512 RepID=A0AAN7FMY8_QUERU|nr:hypothetical protein RGQ29_017265 [Quercus rubra]
MEKEAMWREKIWKDSQAFATIRPPYPPPVWSLCFSPKFAGKKTNVLSRVSLLLKNPSFHEKKKNAKEGR